MEFSDKVNIREYASSSMHSEVDKRIADFVADLKTSWKSDVGGSLAKLQTVEPWWLVLYSQRMAALAVRERNATFITDGLNALAIASHSDLDWRDIKRFLAPLYHSLMLLDNSAEAEFKPEVPPKQFFGLVIDGFPSRSEDDKSLEVMGFLEESSDSGFRYRRIGSA